jgi:hypothetical protein
MKIHFCDLCNESVPQGDLDEGRALLRKGRVVCAACDRAMSHHDPNVPGAGDANANDTRASFAGSAQGFDPEERTIIWPPGDAAPGMSTSEPPPMYEPAPILTSAPPIHSAPAPHVFHARPVTTSSGLWVGLLGLLFTAGAIFVLDERIQIIEKRADETTKELDARSLEVSSLLRRAGLAEDQQKETEKRFGQRLDAEKTRRDDLTAELARARRENADLNERITGLVSSVAALEQKAGSGSFDLEKRIADLSARLARGEDEAHAMAEKLATLEAATPVAAASEPKPEAKPQETGWHLQLAGLKSDSPSTRWESVTTLGATKDPETVPYIAPMLKDPDIFVRMAAARVLGDMQAKGGVPALIDALEDSETAVREAANIALRTITNKDFKFDPLAIEAERARRVKAWRDWWKKEGESPSGM